MALSEPTHRTAQCPLTRCKRTRAVIADNLISGTHRGAILGMDRHTPVTGDLTNDGARFAQLAISGNRVR